MNALSPLSTNSTDWSPIGGYQAFGASSNPSPNPNPTAAPDTPPVSNHTSSSTATTDGGMQNNMPRRRPSNGNPSPPSSVAGSVAGSMDSSRRAYMEEQLSEHYRILKNYLNPYLRDQPPNPHQNRARDKLVRLSSIQFQELSTDVYDELLRREEDRKRVGPNGVGGNTPKYLLPQQNFHFKRNQARQKLSTLPPDRFRQLATDVFYELERRYPRFTGGDGRSASRAGSIAGSVASGVDGRLPPSRTRTPNGMPPPPRGDSRGPLDERQQPRGQPFRQPSPFSGPPHGIQHEPDALPANGFGRPLPKTFHQNTIIPSKGQLVEDDGNSSTDEAPPSALTDVMAPELKTQISQLEAKVDSLQSQLTLKTAEVEKARSGATQHIHNAEAERSEWTRVRIGLEQKLKEAQNLNDNLQTEVERLRRENSTVERDLRAQLDNARRNERELEQDLKAQIETARREKRDIERELGTELDELRSRSVARSRRDSDDQLPNDQRFHQLQGDLDEQRRITEEVRRDASQYLQDMRLMAQTSADALEKEERLLDQVAVLEREVRDWKNKYAAAKTRERTLRASSMGLPISNGDAAQFSQFMSLEGAVKDFHLTNYQLAIDELLHLARKPDASSQLVECMKQVVVCVRRISSDVDVANPDATLNSTSRIDSVKQQVRLKTRLSQTANNLITAVKSHAAAAGLAPVSLLDAAASNLTTAVIDLIRDVKIRPTPPEELQRLEQEEYEQIHRSSKPMPFNMRTKSAISSESGSTTSNGINAVNGSVAGHVRNMSSMSSAGYSNYSRYSRYSQSVNGDANGSTANGKQNGLGISSAMGMGMVRESGIEEFKNYLEDSTALLVRSIQPLVNTIRGGANNPRDAQAIQEYIRDIGATVQDITVRTSEAVYELQQDRTGKALARHAPPVTAVLEECRANLLRDGLPREQVPPVAFRIARATKELVLRVDRIESGDLAADVDLPTEI